MYESLTYKMILQRMLDRVSNNVDKREGSIVWDALAPAAVELKQMYIEFDDIMNESFADTASREFLIRRCAERGITPDPATYAVLQGEFTPTTINMSGRRFSMPNQNTNYTVKEMISAGAYRVQCETIGTEGNMYLGTIIPIDYVDGLQTATLTDVLIPARDDQDTEALRQEYFNSFSKKAFGGNSKDYLDTTNGIEGVGATKVTPIWNGGGTVKLTILDAQYNTASSILVDAVQQMIDPTQDGLGIGLAPIGHVVTVDTASEVTANITTTLTLNTGATWASVQQQVIDSIQGYFLELREEWANATNQVVKTWTLNDPASIVRIAQIETRILAVQGVIDVTNTQINGAASNLNLTAYQVAVFGGITI